MPLPPGLAAWKAKKSKNAGTPSQNTPPGSNTTKSAPLVSKVVQPPSMAKGRDPHRSGPPGHMSYKNIKP